MKVHLIGWNENALNALKGLLFSKHKVVGVTVPSGYSVQSIQTLCSREGVNFSMAKNETELMEAILATNPDVVVSASWPKIIHRKLLELPGLIFLNIHAALLPKNRGVHPINWAIIRGEECTGVSVHIIEKGVDDGPIIVQKKVKISEYDNARTIRKKLTDLSGSIVVLALDRLTKKNFVPTPQDLREATYAPRRAPEDGKINWSLKTTDIRNLIRGAVYPYPGGFSQLRGGKVVKISNTFVPRKRGVVLFKYKKWFGVSTLDGVVLIESNDLSVGDVLV
ncbi:MAG: methionyl-tRNA formyltransferase [Patescibacteria group bacterium]